MAKSITRNKSISGGTLYSTDSDHILATAHDVFDEKRQCYVEDYDFGVKTVNNTAPDTNGNVNITIPSQVQANWTETNTSAKSYIQNKPTLAKVATSGSYTDLSNKPTIPAEQIQSDWNQTSTNSKDYIKNKPTLANVATSGSYNDLTDKPTIPSGQQQVDWNATSGVTSIKNKPNLATVATSGSYSDLKDKPSLNYLPLTGGTMVNEGSGKDGTIKTQAVLPAIDKGAVEANTHISKNLGSNEFQYASIYSNVLAAGHSQIWGSNFYEGSWPQLDFFCNDGYYKTAKSTNEDRATPSKGYDSKIYDNGSALNFKNRNSSIKLSHPDIKSHHYDKDRASGSKFYDLAADNETRMYLDDKKYFPDGYELAYYETNKIDPTKYIYNSDGSLNYEATREALSPFLNNYSHMDINSAFGSISMEKIWSIGNDVTYIATPAYNPSNLRISVENELSISCEELVVKPAGVSVSYSENAFLKTNTIFNEDSDFKSNCVFFVNNENSEATTITLNHVEHKISSGRIATFVSGVVTTIKYQNIKTTSGSYETLELPKGSSITFIHSDYGTVQGWYPIGGVGNGGVKNISSCGVNIEPDTNGTVTLNTITLKAWDTSSDSTTTFTIVGKKN